jgi:CRISPR-associated protein Cas1
VARTLVDAKLANSHALLRRHTGDAAVEEARRRLRRARRQLPQAGTLDAVRGHEGDGAAALFGVFGRLVKVPGFAFERRTRRPPTDPVNSLLSLGYTLLYHHARAFLRVCGLHAHAGFLHEARPDHPALASDLVEPFRVLVERLALRLLNRRVLNPSDFRCPEDGGACLLTAGARKRFFQAFEKLLSQEAPSPEEGRAVTYRRRLHDAAQNVAQFVQGEAEIEPFRLR